MSITPELIAYHLQWIIPVVATFTISMIGWNAWLTKQVFDCARRTDVDNLKEWMETRWERTENRLYDIIRNGR